MHGAFQTVVFVVVALGAIAAVVALAHTNRTYGHIGGGGVDRDPQPDPGAARDDDIREMLAARNARRAARGEPALDLEDELAALAAPAPEAALEAEARDLVHATNRRRVARGQPPLDVEAEVARRLGRRS